MNSCREEWSRSTTFLGLLREAISGTGRVIIIHVLYVLTLMVLNITFIMLKSSKINNNPKQSVRNVAKM